MNQVIQQRKNAKKSAVHLKWFWYFLRTLEKSNIGLLINASNNQVILPDKILQRRGQVFDGILTKDVWL